MLVATLLIIIICLVLTHRSVRTTYLTDGRMRNDNDDERRLLESPTPEEEAESLRSDTRQVTSIAEAADKLIAATATAADNNIIPVRDHKMGVGNQCEVFCIKLSAMYISL